LGALRLQVGASQSSVACTSASRSDRTATYSSVGRSAVASDAYLDGQIAGLHVVDALFTSAETAVIATRMRAGTDPLVGCAACAAGLRGPCDYTCPAGTSVANPNLFAVNLDDLTVWYEFEGDARDTVSNELIMTQLPATGAIGTFVYTVPVAGLSEEAHARHVVLNHDTNPMTTYSSTPLGHDVSL